VAAASKSMQKKYARWIDFLYGPFFRVIGFFYRIYTANRARVERIKAHEGLATFLKIVTVVVLIGWILIWMFASEESRNRLTDEVKQTIGGLEASTPQ
jgi:hypothetical protein